MFLDLLADPAQKAIIPPDQKLPKLHPVARIVVTHVVKAMNVWRKPKPDLTTEPAPTVATSSAVAVTDSDDPDIPAKPVMTQLPMERDKITPALWEPFLSGSLSASPPSAGTPYASPSSPIPPWLMSGKRKRKTTGNPSKR